MAWYDEAFFYHIYPLGLCGAPKTNSYGEEEHRLRELWPWVEHLEQLGVTGLYIGPLFESGSHGYDTTDYRRLDRRLGSNGDLKDFVRHCHDHGIRVVLDAVFNHSGRDFFAFRDLKERREQSAYQDWYCSVNFWNNNEYNDGFSYDNWGGYNLLAKFNLRNPEVVNYHLETVRYWVSEFDIDGLRLDTADVLDFDFMRALRGLPSMGSRIFFMGNPPSARSSDRVIQWGLRSEQLLNGVRRAAHHAGDLFRGVSQSVAGLVHRRAGHRLGLFSAAGELGLGLGDDLFHRFVGQVYPQNAFHSLDGILLELLLQGIVGLDLLDHLVDLALDVLHVKHGDSLL